MNVAWNKAVRRIQDAFVDNQEGPDDMVQGYLHGHPRQMALDWAKAGQYPPFRAEKASNCARLTHFDHNRIPNT